MLQWIVGFALEHNLLIYLLIIFLAFLQGPLLAVIFGVLLRLGYLHYIPIYIALMVGDLVGDTIWYHVGRIYGHRFVARFGKYFGITEHKIEIMTTLFHRYKNYVLFLSKITNGFGFAIVTLMTAGMVRIPFKMYLFVNLLGQFIWTGTLLAAGFYFSEAYIKIDRWDGQVSLVVGGIIALVAIYRYWLYLKGRVERISIPNNP
ncbi:MAG: DedA family protein [Candidatus Paceibacterota bacterium]